MNYQRPLSKKKTLQLFLWLTILAWATQTFFHQLGWGQVVSPDMLDGAKFVPADSRTCAVLEFKSEATVLGADVTLKQVCRWPAGDAAVFAPIADLTISHISGKSPFQTITIDDLRQTLHDAGVNLAMINLTGSSSCTVTRTDTATDDQTALQRWLDTQQKAAATILPDTAADAKNAAGPHPKSLRDILTEELAQRLNVPAASLQVSFTARDEQALSLAEPFFKFDISASRARTLGSVNWDVTVSSESNKAVKNLTVHATARAWQEQVMVARPIAYKQLLADGDFTQRKILSDSLPDDTLLTMDQCVGNQAARELKPGTVMTARLVDPTPLVKPGQLVTVNVISGGVTIKAVARALEQGSMGQTIKVRNDATKETFDVTVVGAQETRLSAGK